MVGRMLRGLVAVLTVSAVWWLAFGVTAALAMADPLAIVQEGSRLKLALADAFQSPAASLELVAYRGAAWLLSKPLALTVAVLLGLVGATARSSDAHRTLIVTTAKALLALGTAVQVFWVGAVNIAYGTGADVPWLDWAAVLLVTIVAVLGVLFGVQPISRDRSASLTALVLGATFAEGRKR
jgi:hypothetical protein